MLYTETGDSFTMMTPCPITPSLHCVAIMDNERLVASLGSRVSFLRDSNLRTRINKNTLSDLRLPEVDQGLGLKLPQGDQEKKKQEGNGHLDLRRLRFNLDRRRRRKVAVVH